MVESPEQPVIGIDLDAFESVSIEDCGNLRS